MVSIETGETDPTAATLRLADPKTKRRGAKAKQLANGQMNGNDYHEGHDHLGMAGPTQQDSYEELSAKRANKEVEAAKIQEVRIASLS